MSETGCFVLIATLVAMIILLLVQDYFNSKAFEKLNRINDELLLKVLILEDILEFKRNEKEKEDENEKQDSSDL